MMKERLFETNNENVLRVAFGACCVVEPAQLVSARSEMIPALNNSNVKDCGKPHVRKKLYLSKRLG